MTLGYGFWKGDSDFIWCLIVTIRLPCRVSDIIGCYFHSELRQGALHVVSVS